MSQTEKASILGIVAYERDKFAKTLKTMQNAYGVRLRDMNTLCKVRLAEGIKRVEMEMKDLFKREFRHIIEQHNALRSALYNSNQDVLHWQERFVEQTNRVCELQRHIKYDYDESQKQLLMRDWDEEHEISPTAQEIEQANQLLQIPFSFYGGYV